MPITEFPLDGFYDQQRFLQYSPQDCANWYPVAVPSGKRGKALYPAMGRAHINVNGLNRLIFPVQPREIFRTVDFYYVVVASTIYRYDKNFNQVILVNSDFTQVAGDFNYAYLPVAQAPTSTPTAKPDIFPTYVMVTDNKHCYLIDESIAAGSMVTVTDTNAPVNPQYVVAFGNRFVVSSRNTTQFQLTQVNLGTHPIDITKIFTDSMQAVFAQETGIIRQMCVLHNLLFIFTDFTTGIWGNITSVIGTATFPFKKNTSFDWDYGMADPKSMAIGFGMLVWLAQNADGILTFMMSTGQSPEVLSTQAINVLLQHNENDELSPFITEDVNGFLYQYENTVFYRASAGAYTGTQLLDDTLDANSLEFNFESKTWGRCIELNGERNRIEKHIFFDNRHLVTVQSEGTIYQMAGNIYFNEIRNPNIADPQSRLAYVAYPFRYEYITKIISAEDYAEFADEYVEIDFVYGDQTFVKSSAPFQNTVFIIAELSTPTNPIYLVAEDGQTFLITEDGNTPELDSVTYNDLLKPYMELYFSNDGGVSYQSADLRQFSDLGVYEWRMRWYQMGTSRNRAYKLVCVSPSPIVVLGGVIERVRKSGGAN